MFKPKPQTLSRGTEQRLEGFGTLGLWDLVFTELYEHAVRLHAQLDARTPS